MIRILIVDDHKMLRDGLRRMLQDEPLIRVIGEASHGKEAIELLSQIEVDVILMDISMPVMDGVEASAMISSLYPHVRIIALTMLEQGSFVQLMLRNGAHGYLLKTAGKQELIEAITIVQSGKRYLAQDVTDLLIGNVARQQTGPKSILPALTRREREVLKLITQGMSDSDISTTLFISPTTAESHRKNIRSKLGARNSAEIVRIAMERGLVQ